MTNFTKSVTVPSKAELLQALKSKATEVALLRRRVGAEAAQAAQQKHGRHKNKAQRHGAQQGRCPVKHQQPRPCRFFMQGKCTRGEQCRYLHVEPRGARKALALVPSSSPGSTGKQGKSRQSKQCRKKRPSNKKEKQQVLQMAEGMMAMEL